MIVKNESQIIVRLLESVLPIIDCYCICDTGSTDNTIQMIELFMQAKQKPGIIFKEPFRDFGYNRTMALYQCQNSELQFDYILLLDADMVLNISQVLATKLNELDKDAYYIFQGNTNFYYKNIRLIKNMPGFTYAGVTHEHLNTPTDAIIETLEMDQIFISDIGDGGSKTNKFERDIELLKQGLIDEPNNARYLFYLANSYRDAEQYSDAIDTFKRRIAIGGWNEEIWHSYYSIGNCYQKLNDIPNAIFNWMEAYHIIPNRIENLYKIINYYRTTNKYDLANLYYNVAQNQLIKSKHVDHLFLERDIYDYKLDFEFTIFAYYCKDSKHNVLHKCMQVLKCRNIDAILIQNVLNNYKFYTESLVNMKTNTHYSKLQPLQIMPGFSSSTPSICLNKATKQLIINIRYVNYNILPNGLYDINGENITRNVIVVYNMENKMEKSTQKQWIKTNEFELQYNTAYNNLYKGVEDMRLLVNDDGMLYFSGNRQFDGKIMIEHGLINIKSQQTRSNMVTTEQQAEYEKNWVMFINPNNKTRINMVYKWHPLTIGYIGDHHEKIIDKHNNPLSELFITHKIPTPPLFQWLRGSTNGIILLSKTDQKTDQNKKEIWFICHIVSHENRRYYYHLFVVLDSETYQVKRFSRIFTFEKSPVEYTLGFVHLEESNEFLIGYSIMDRETKYMTISKDTVDGMMYVIE